MLKLKICLQERSCLVRSYIRGHHELTEKQAFFQKLGREFSNNFIKPFSAKYDSQSSIPIEKIKEFGKSGLLGMMATIQDGGLDADYISYCLALEEISSGCASMGILMSINNGSYLWPVAKFSTSYQKEKYVMPFAKGEKIGCFALTEPHCGSDAVALSTTSVLKDDHYIINGTKSWVSYCNIGSAILLFAKTDSNKTHKGVSAFLVDLPSDGVTIGKGEKLLGIKGVYSGDVIFKDCKVSKQNLLGEEGNGFFIAMEAINRGRIGVASQALGIARAALEYSIDYSMQRTSSGSPISKFQSIKIKIADMSTRLHASRLMIHHAAYLMNEKKPYTKEASMAKLFTSETATFITHQALQIAGGMGYSCNLPLERHYRDARATEIYGGTSEIQRMIIADNILKHFNPKI